ncbi:MAG TPA: hypothetical protein VFP05_17020 [Thermomicrobiales bacterium]|nr:hypothetical protein [Thermomicrobiales bacterium]
MDRSLPPHPDDDQPTYQPLTIGHEYVVKAVAPPLSGNWPRMNFANVLKNQLIEQAGGEWVVAEAVPPVDIPEVAPAPAEFAKAQSPGIYVDKIGLAGLLDQLNADARFLRDGLTQFETFMANQGLAPEQITAAINWLVELLEAEKPENDARIDRLAQIANTENDEIEVLAGILEEIKNDWLSVCRTWPLRDSTGADALADSAATKLELNQIIENTGYITSLQMLNRWLAGARVGDVITFEAVRGTELPDPEMRKTVLARLKLTPKLVSGWIDVEKGTIQRSGTGWQDSLIAMIGLMLSVIGPLLLFYFWYRSEGSVEIGSFDLVDQVSDTIPSPFRTFAEFSILALLGAAVPYFGGLVTVHQAGGNVNFRDIWARFVANQSNVWLGAIVVWVAIILVTALDIDIGRGGAFFLGFSAEKVVASQLTQLREKADSALQSLTDTPAAQQ